VNRIVAKPQKIGDEQVRHRVRLEDSVESREGTVDWIARQQAMLGAVLATAELLHCGPGRWQKLSMYHDGERWVIEAEAILNERA